MKQRIFWIGLLLVVTALFCAALYWNGDYIIYILTYAFAFAFLLCYTIFDTSGIGEKIGQTTVYALILAAQILFAVLVMRPASGAEALGLYRLLGVLVIFVPFLVRQIWRSYI